MDNLVQSIKVVFTFVITTVPMACIVFGAIAVWGLHDLSGWLLILLGVGLYVLEIWLYSRR